MANVTQLRTSGRQHAEFAKQIKEIMSDDFDAQTFRDTLEGASDFPEQLACVLREVKAREAMAEGLKRLESDLADRRARLEHGAQRLRDTAAAAMMDSGERTLRYPDMTVSVTQRPKLLIDEDQLPDEFKREVITIKVDRDKLRAAVDAGQTFIPGVTFGNAAPSITVRVK